MYSLLRIIVLVLLVCIAAWHLSSDDQRRRLMVAFSIAESVEQAERVGLRLVIAGREIELLAPVPGAAPEDAPAAAPLAPAIARLPSAPSPARSPAGESIGPEIRPQLGRGIGHGGDPCAVGMARNPTRARAAARVHRYVDDTGQVVFSDRAPSGLDADVIEVTGDIGVSRFSAEYDFDGLSPPLGFQSQLEIDLDGVFHFLADDLGLRDAQPVHLRLRIVDGRARFARLADGAGLSTDSGFYSHTDNLAVVRWMGDAPTRAVARHEIAHLALGNWLGRTPLWLNEGLAEVVERMRFRQSFAIADVPAQQLARLRELDRSGRLPPLRTFLTSRRQDWNRWGNDLAYTYAWSLVHFLLQEPGRQRTVAGLLGQLAAHRCRHFDHLAFLERDYFGGIDGLHRDWRRWLAAEAAPLHF